MTFGLADAVEEGEGDPSFVSTHLALFAPHLLGIDLAIIMTCLVLFRPNDTWLTCMSVLH